MTQALYQRITPLERMLITVVVMSATLMQVIDTTIVNVALPHMEGALSASPDEITWTITSYLVSSAIFMPLTGFFSDLFGRKKYLILSIIGFTFVSGCCGASVSLDQIVIFRLLQGIFGAALVPLSQAILTDIFPPEDRGKAMAIWGIGVMIGPILGPTLGGYLTDIASWRWTFYVNVPVGIFTLLLAHVIPDSPVQKRRMDWRGLILISTAIGGLQYVLDRGNSADWFGSTSICIVSYIAVSSFLGFILHNMHNQHQSVFDLRIFKDKNFAIASMLICIFGLGFYGVMIAQPLMMEGILNYPVLTTGFILAPRGISGMISMMIVSRIIHSVDSRWLITLGISICGIGIWLGTFFSMNVDMKWLILPMILQGFGFGMIFVPLSTVAFITLPAETRTEAAGLFSLLRTIGGSIGISVTITLLTRGSQLYWNQLGSFIQPYNPALQSYLHPLHLAANQPLGSAILAHELYNQAYMMSFINVFQVIAWAFVLMIPLVMMLDSPKKTTLLQHAAFD